MVEQSILSPLSFQSGGATTIVKVLKSIKDTMGNCSCTFANLNFFSPHKYLWSHTRLVKGNCASTKFVQLCVKVQRRNQERVTGYFRE